MKVGILTFHRAINYGAALQTYALAHKMNELGFDAEVADYRNPHIENSFHKFSFSKINSPGKAAAFVLGFRNRHKKKKAFERFMSLTPKGNRCDIAGQLEKEGYDLFVTGSDQVWNPDCTEFDKTYFLDFTEHEKKASYAASFGVSSLDERYAGKAGELLKDYKYIAVREKQGAEIVKNIADREATVVLDPTLLLDKKQWQTVAKPSKYGKRKFLLVYMLLNSSSLLNFAEKKAKEQNLEIICIGNGRRKNVTYAKDIGPDEFIDLFMRAEMVVTNSFHGTAFSINFNKEFYVELHNVKKSRNSRMEDVLELFDLKSRLIMDGEGTNEQVNCEKVRGILEEERKRSINYIKSMN